MHIFQLAREYNMETIAFFGSSRMREDSQKYIEVKHLGKLFAESGYNISTGAYKGVMEAALNGAKKYPVDRIGVTTKDYPRKKPNQYVNKVIECDSYLDRLGKLIEISDAYIIFDGSTGTLLELLSVIALKDRRKISQKPIVILSKDFFEIIQFMSEKFKKFKKIMGFVYHTTDIRQAFEYVDDRLKDNKASASS